jgi:hypothetical protein
LAQHAANESKQRQTQTVRPRTDTMTMTTEIPEKAWDSFCQRLKDWYRGVVSIRWIQPGGDMRMVVEGMPLQHQIIEPFRVILRKNGESGRYNELEILAETGKTEITFTPGIDASFLEKLAA